MSIPQSTISVCGGVRLNSRYEHSIYFADRTAQLNYFAGKVVKTFSAYSFIRKSWDLNVAATMEEAASWSYLFFTNTANAKRYYYFIDNIEYVNDGTVRLKLQIDVLQTYLFDFELLPSFVERQHVTDDTRGAHTIDEGLETGDLIDNAVSDFSGIETLCILVLASINPNYADTDKPVPALSGMYNSIFSGLKVWAVNSSDWGEWGAQLDALSEAGFLDGIVSMWMYPKNLVELGGENTWSDGVLCKIVESFPSAGISSNVGFNVSTVDGYTPKNNKLLCYPFNFLYCSNNNGGSAVYKYERFSGSSATFNLYGALSPDAPVLLTPTKYNGVDKNFEHALTLGNFPACAWDADVYKMWLAQNQNQHNNAAGQAAIKVGAGAVAGIASLATGNIAGAVGGVGMMYSGVTQISGLLAQKRDMEIQPPQARGQFSTNINIAASKQTFTFYKKSVNAEHAKMIDDFFTMYGYKINRVQKPNIHARKSHTYIKTVGCHIDADLCNEDTIKIEAIFDHGVTFWTNGDRIGQYDDDNSTL